MKIRLALALAGLGCTAMYGNAQNGGRLLVTEKGAMSLGVVDPKGPSVVSISEGQLPGKDTGHEVAASRDGKLAYVPIYGDSGVGKPGSDGRMMEVIDIASQKIVQRIDFGHPVRPHLPVLGPPSAGFPDGRLYVTTELDQTVTVIDPKTMTIVGAISTGQPESHMLAVSHDGKRGYTANVGPGTVSVLDLTGKSAKPIAIIPVAGHVQRISISNDDRYVFTSDVTKPQLAVIDTKTNQVAKWIPLSSTGYGSASTPDGRWLLVALQYENKVAVIDLKAMTVVKTIDVAATPQAVVMRPDGKTAYVSCDKSGQVAEIDIASWTVKQLIPVGKLSDGLAWAAGQ